MSDTELDAIRDRIRLLAEMVGGPTALAGLLEVHPTSLFGYVSGRRPIPTARLHAIAAKFPCDLQWLLHGDGPAPSPDPLRTAKAKESSREQRMAGMENLKSAVEKYPLGLQIVRREGERIDLEKARVRTMQELRTHQPEIAIEVLGESLMQSVLDGRACPSAYLLDLLAQKLGIKPRWLYGLEE